MVLAAPPGPRRPVRRILLLAALLVPWFAAAEPVTGDDEAPRAVPEPAQGWVWPLLPAPQVVATFDAPDGPYGPGHRGVDVEGTVGQPVLAVDEGEVSFAGQVAGRGVVVVDHGRLRTSYEPVAADVRRGAEVSAGTRLGTLGVFGSHCLPAACLHLGVRVGDVYLDPLRFLATGPIRLLPVVQP